MIDNLLCEIIDEEVQSNEVALLLSGGVDSTIATYALFKYVTDFEIDVEFYPMVGNDKMRPYSTLITQKVINWIIEKFPNIKVNPWETWDNTIQKRGDESRVTKQEYDLTLILS